MACAIYRWLFATQSLLPVGRAAANESRIHRRGWPATPAAMVVEGLLQRGRRHQCLQTRELLVPFRELDPFRVELVSRLAVHDQVHSVKANDNLAFLACADRIAGEYGIEASMDMVVLRVLGCCPTSTSVPRFVEGNCSAF